jgi:uncharacterized membrane protein
MKGHIKKTAILFITVLIILTLAATIHAQSYTITRWTVDGGGGTGTGGSYTLSGTIGQPDAGVLSGGTYTLIGGFWGFDEQHFIYLPLILRN